MSERTRVMDLSGFRGTGYEKGRSVVWQTLWFCVLNLAFSRWWFPPRLRPPLLRLFGARVGTGVLIRHRVRIHWPWKLTIGDYSWVGEGAWILNLEPVTVGANVCVSQEAFLCTGSHDVRSPTFEFANRPIDIGESSWICARAIVLAGSRVPPGTVVPAGAVFRGATDTAT